MLAPSPGGLASPPTGNPGSAPVNHDDGLGLWYRTYQQLKHQQAACTCTEDTSFC